MKTDSLKDNLNRLESIRRSDAGLYTVALHAFIEAWASGSVGTTRDLAFRDVMQAWFRDHRDSFPGLSAETETAVSPVNPEDDLMSILHAVSRDHRLTNHVRHGFARLSSEEARGATWNFIRLGRYAGWSDNPGITPIQGSLDTWEERESAAEDSELASLKTPLANLQSRSAELLEQRTMLEVKEGEILALKQNLYAAGHGSAGSGGNAPEQIRSSILALRREIDSSDYRQYIRGLSRFTHAARTRRDYEKQLVRLTPEQHEALSDFSTDTDMLITGGAGTGKTLVLLESLARTLNNRTPELQLGQPTSTTLVTFTKTLVKYDRYLANLMAPQRVQDSDLESSETFFWKKLKLKEPAHKVDYNLLRSMMAGMNTSGVLSDAELWIEIEEFLFGLNIRRDEYLDAEVPRKGLKTPLNLKEREAVWNIRDDIEDHMLSRGVYSKHYARMRLLHYLAEDPSGLITHDSLFVDESQDMSAVELMALKKLAGRSLIMAGDTGQSIYGFINPYRRANLQLGQNQIRVLKTNHRNTIPIHNMAESFRRSGLGTGEDPGPESYPFREGPDPETHQLEDPDKLADLLAAKARMYVSDLGYPAEALGVLCSRTAHLKLIAGKLKNVGLESAVVKGDGFEFADQGAVRLSTLHSSKGLDFPVVLMYLPELPPAREIDPPYQDRLYRNLQYVAMSRGMDVVEVFSEVGIG